MSTLTPTHLVGPSDLVSALTAPAIRSARSLYLSAYGDTLRVAVLAEISGTAAALARRAALLSHVDLRQVLTLVTDPADVRAVLGRGAWLPTMARPIRVPATPATPVPGLPVDFTQLDLFPAGAR